MRTIGVVTVGRSDYGILLPLMRKIAADVDLRLAVFVSGAHLLSEFGSTVEDIRRDGFRIAATIEMASRVDTPGGIAESMGRGVSGFATAFDKNRPDILVALGDRFEMHAAVSAAAPLLIPVAHIAGGAVTAGAIDELFRHSITKLSHLHFAETRLYARRIIRMGEDPWRVTVAGSMALDNIREMRLLPVAKLRKSLGLAGRKKPLLITFHPVSREHDRTAEYVWELLAALDRFDLPMVITYPNVDPAGRLVVDLIEKYATSRPNVRTAASLGTRAYFSVMKHALAMVGNSSSGIVESPSFRLPVVNIGTRQGGRTTAKNVITTGYDRDAIASGITRALSMEFRKSLANIVNPYGDGHASERILHVLKTVVLGARLIDKRFCD